MQTLCPRPSGSFSSLRKLDSPAPLAGWLHACLPVIEWPRLSQPGRPGRLAIDVIAGLQKGITHLRTAVGQSASVLLSYQPWRLPLHLICISVGCLSVCLSPCRRMSSRQRKQWAPVRTLRTESLPPRMYVRNTFICTRPTRPAIRFRRHK